jgi:hypothetical protein
VKYKIGATVSFRDVFWNVYEARLFGWHYLTGPYQSKEAAEEMVKKLSSATTTYYDAEGNAV